MEVAIQVITMEIPQEIIKAAQELGSCLRDHASVQAYLDCKQRVDADPDVIALEDRLEALYSELLTREQSGESLTREDLEPYYDLREQVRQHPLLSMRDAQLQMVQPMFAQISTEISNILGMDYTALAVRVGEDE
jgi:cell fate (sporulation/competence/biofilm development) regulator YlbF (YheA/YmcA/DUF963 family)